MYLQFAIEVTLMVSLLWLMTRRDLSFPSVLLAVVAAIAADIAIGFSGLSSQLPVSLMPYYNKMILSLYVIVPLAVWSFRPKTDLLVRLSYAFCLLGLNLTIFALRGLGLTDALMDQIAHLPV
ncbi:hypothetical protein [Ferrimonas marina]|uniref:Uncharacterized protein n=1 Tax=Ferrimonas marina TaxID=299255 RepID=A0A1M5S356_9GAMM|nr:hypothetical protein [Ferrimonas marina]SHH32901.1 hypothetical protein SAMN02745129_1852 [Ferrimonas marina]